MESNRPIARIAFFLTGHGFGHGVRNAAIMDALPPGVEITVFTSLPEAFFREELRRPVRVVPCEIDCGCLQRDTVEVEVEATLERYRELDAARHQAVARFAPMLREWRPDLVIGDIPPLAFPIAEAAGAECWSICNFTWVDIYRPYVAKHPRYGDLLKRMEEDYSRALRRIRLFPHMDCEGLDAAEDVGLLCRPGIQRREEFARRFGLDPSKKWCLVYVGNFGLEGVSWSRLARYSDWEFMGLYPLADAPSNYKLIQKDPGFRYTDLTASCDAVLGKLGYGLVAQCLSLGKPVLFMGRSDFNEFDLLKQLVESRGAGMEISLEKLRRLDLGEELEFLGTRALNPMPALGLGQILEKIGFPHA